MTNEEKPEMVMMSKSEFIKRIADACSDGASVERESVRERLLVIRELTEPGSKASIELTKWVHEIG